jgi:hypothetical protein
MTQLSAAITPRDVTEAEIAFYRENGWVTLERLIAPEEAADLLERAQRLMGAHAEALSRTRSEGIHRRPDHIVAMWRNHELPSEDDEVYRELALSPKIGRIADRFLDGRGAPLLEGRGARENAGDRGGSVDAVTPGLPVHAA